MRVLGIDPGTVHMGFGVVEGEGTDVAFIDCGVLEAPPRDPIEKRLLTLHHQIQALMDRVLPEEVAVEEPFVYQGPRKAALAVGEARAIALIAAAGRDLPVFQYPPASVKQAVAGYGAGTKEQVRDMVGLLLQRQLADYSLDACDALAVAICHVQRLRLNDLLVAAEKSGEGPRGRRVARGGRR